MGGGGEVVLFPTEPIPAGGEYVLLKSVAGGCCCLLEMTAPLCVLLNFRDEEGEGVSSSLPPKKDLCSLLPTCPMDRVKDSGFFSRVLPPLGLILARVSGEESDDRGDSRKLPWDRVLCWSSGGAPPPLSEEAGEAGSGVFRGVGEVLWSSRVSPASLSIMWNKSSMLESAGMSVGNKINTSSTTFLQMCC